MEPEKASLSCSRIRENSFVRGINQNSYEFYYKNTSQRFLLRGLLRLRLMMKLPRSPLGVQTSHFIAFDIFTAVHSCSGSEEGAVNSQMARRALRTIDFWPTLSLVGTGSGNPKMISCSCSLAFPSHSTRHQNGLVLCRCATTNFGRALSPACSLECSAIEKERVSRNSFWCSVSQVRFILAASNNM